MVTATTADQAQSTMIATSPAGTAWAPTVTTAVHAPTVLGGGVSSVPA